MLRIGKNGRLPNGPHPAVHGRQSRTKPEHAARHLSVDS